MKMSYPQRAFALLVGVFWLCCAATVCFAQSPVDVVTLSPGDSRSLEYEFNGTLSEGDPSSYHFAMITAFAPDQEIHQLTITISPLGDVGSEIQYFSGGLFLSFSSGLITNIEIMEPKFTYGFNHATYIVDVNPTLTTGFLFTGATFEFAHFDFPLEMTMTLTLSY